MMSDPVAQAAYQDAQRRTRMLAAMATIRQREGLTQTDVAKAMHTTQSSVSEIEPELCRYRPRVTLQCPQPRVAWSGLDLGH